MITHANDGGVAAGADPELAEALLLVRVSTMKMLRLQLAIERRDRAVALQTVDDLVELDEWMAGYANRMANDPLFDAIAREVDGERQALLREKFSLAAGLVKREAEPGPRPWAEPDPEPAPAIVRGDHEQLFDFLGPADAIPHEEPVHRTRWWLVGAVAMLLIGACIGAALLLGWRPDVLLAQLLSHGGW